MKEKIKALYKRPGKTLVEVEIPNELEWLQGVADKDRGSESLADILHILRPEQADSEWMYWWKWRSSRCRVIAINGSLWILCCRRKV